MIEWPTVTPIQAISKLEDTRDYLDEICTDIQRVATARMWSKSVPGFDAWNSVVTAAMSLDSVDLERLMLKMIRVSESQFINNVLQLLPDEQSNLMFAMQGVRLKR